MTKPRTALFATLGLAGISGIASANSFNINEHDARVTGRGGASAASDDDASSIVFNPGGLALSEGTQIMLGGSLYIAKGSYENDTTPKVTTDSPPTPVPNLYIASRVHEMLAVGIGVHFPFGLAVTYPDDHPQSTVAVKSNLKTMFISPVIGVNLHKQVPGLSLGGGIDIVPASVELERALVFGTERGSVDLAADGIGFGFRAGVMYHPPAVKSLKLGVMYRHKVKLDFEGQADFDIADPFRAQLPPDGDASTTITLPASISGGVAYSPIANLEIEFNAVWINWKKTFTADEARGDGATSLSLALPGGNTSDIPEDYKNTVSYRVGFDYKLPAYQASVRAGFIYDPTPIPTTTVTAQLPDVDRIALTVGASRQLSPQLGLDVSALWVTPGERDSSSDPAVPIFHGTYGVEALVLSVGLTGRFGGKSQPAPASDPVASNQGVRP
ncbi:MAG: outer membrane protein transport protein [Kofleriaceae bacterium]